MKTQKKTNKYVKKHTEKTLQESYEAELFQALGQSFTPIVKTFFGYIDRLSNVVGQAVDSAGSIASSTSSIPQEVKRFTDSLMKIKKEFDNAQSGFTKTEKDFFKEQIKEALRIANNNPSMLRDLLFGGAEEVAASIKNKLEVAEEIIRDAGNFNIKKLAPRSDYEIYRKDRKKYRGKDGSRRPVNAEDLQDILMDQTKINEVFKLIKQNYKNLIEYIGNELENLKKYKEEGGLLNDFLFKSLAIIVNERVGTHLRKLKNARDLLSLEDYDEEYYAVDVASKLAPKEERTIGDDHPNPERRKEWDEYLRKVGKAREEEGRKMNQQQELREFKEFLKDRGLI
jgi:hypothetical protein